MASIIDVAKAAGVSISTVSYALNDDPRIPAVTADRIKAVANEIGYFPSAAARNLKKRSTGTVLVAISDFGGPVYHELLEGIHRQLMADGYRMIVTTGASSVNLLKERSADAAIVADIHLEDGFLARVAPFFGPIIVLDRNLEERNLRHLTLANAQAMRELTEAVIASGRRRLAYVHGVVETFDDRTRHQGFVAALQEHGLEAVAEHAGNFTKPSGEAIAEALLASGGALPDAFVCANDEMAIGIMDVLKRHGYVIPRDVGVTGFDDIELAGYYDPGLSTVRIAHREWGRSAAAAAIGMLRGATAENATQPGTVILRSSF